MRTQEAEAMLTRGGAAVDVSKFAGAVLAPAGLGGSGSTQSDARRDERQVTLG